MTLSTKPWYEIARIATGKRKHAAQITTLRKSDGTLNADLHDRVTHMLQEFTPEDNKEDDSD
jgi:hypothetical protein